MGRNLKKKWMQFIWQKYERGACGVDEDRVNVSEK